MIENSCFVDFHSHILPGMDDGAKNIDDSLQMLQTEKNDGIQYCVLTPHFYASSEDIDTFLDRRTKALEILKERYQESLPHLFLGAEVFYFPGIAGCKNLKKLCIENTHFLLLEMPFSHWGENVIHEVELLSFSGIIPIIAHVERYAHYQERGTLERLHSIGCLFQSNAEAILDRKMRKNLYKFMKKDLLHVLGSDAHNLSDRKPNLGNAIEFLMKDKKDDFLDSYYDFCQFFLGQ